MKLDARSASVEFRRVSKAYGSVVAVLDVSFTVAAGTLVTLLGPSGCGKTTTLRLIAGLEMATSGQIVIGGAGQGVRENGEVTGGIHEENYFLCCRIPGRGSLGRLSRRILTR